MWTSTIQLLKKYFFRVDSWCLTCIYSLLWRKNTHTCTQAHRDIQAGRERDRGEKNGANFKAAVHYLLLPRLWNCNVGLWGNRQMWVQRFASCFPFVPSVFLRLFNSTLVLLSFTDGSTSPSVKSGVEGVVERKVACLMQCLSAKEISKWVEEVMNVEWSSSTLIQAIITKSLIFTVPFRCTSIYGQTPPWCVWGHWAKIYIR